MIAPSPISNPFRAARALAVVSLVALGCVSVEQPRMDPDAPPLLRPGARELLDKPRSHVLVQSDEVTAEMPFDTQLVRRVSLKAKKAVVSIYVRTATPVRVRLFPLPIPGTSFRVRLPGEALGSGFFIHPSGYILTNDHVIRDAREISILTRDGQELEATVIARDPAFDLALMKVEGEHPEFPVLAMGDSEHIGVGEFTIAVGNPLGLGHTVTFGIVSQTGRNLSGIKADEGRTVHFIQMDTAINPGSSGGPLITLTGSWIGVNTAAAIGAQNIGFAFPSNLALEFIDEVLAGKGDLEH